MKYSITPICISFIGISDFKKDFIGKLFAQYINWAYLNTNHIIEAYYGIALKEIIYNNKNELFLTIESNIISSLNIKRTIIFTGNTCSYKMETMQYLQHIGPVVYIYTPFLKILPYLNQLKRKGMLISPAITTNDFEAFFYERDTLYRYWSTHVINDNQPIQKIINILLNLFYNSQVKTN